MVEEASEKLLAPVPILPLSLPLPVSPLLLLLLLPGLVLGDLGCEHCEGPQAGVVLWARCPQAEAHRDWQERHDHHVLVVAMVAMTLCDGQGASRPHCHPLAYPCSSSCCLAPCCYYY